MSLLEKLKTARTPLGTLRASALTALVGMLAGSLLTTYWHQPTPAATVVTSGVVHTTQLVTAKDTKQVQQVVTVEHVVTRTVYRDKTGQVTKEVTQEQGPTRTTSDTKEVGSTVTKDQTVSTIVQSVASHQTSYSLGVAYRQDTRSQLTGWVPSWEHAVVTGAARLGGSPVWLEAGVAPVARSVQLGVRYEW